MPKNADCLPCPCCGGYAKIDNEKMYKMMLQDWHSPEEARYYPATVSCTVCGLNISAAVCEADAGGVSQAQQQAREKAVQKWNTRMRSIIDVRKL